MHWELASGDEVHFAKLHLYQLNGLPDGLGEEPRPKFDTRTNAAQEEEDTLRRGSAGLPSDCLQGRCTHLKDAPATVRRPIKIRTRVALETRNYLRHNPNSTPSLLRAFASISSPLNPGSPNIFSSGGKKGNSATALVTARTPARSTARNWRETLSKAVYLACVPGCLHPKMEARARLYENTACINDSAMRFRG